MVNFPYIAIIENAPAPLVVLFGLAHVAMGWVMYSYAKYFYRKIFKYMLIRELRFKESLKKPEERMTKLFWSELGAEIHKAKIDKNKALGEIPRVSGAHTRAVLRKGVESILQESTVHSVKITIFVLCWLIIDGIKCIYIN